MLPPVHNAARPVAAGRAARVGATTPTVKTRGARALHGSARTQASPAGVEFDDAAASASSGRHEASLTVAGAILI